MFSADKLTLLASTSPLILSSLSRVRIRTPECLAAQLHSLDAPDVADESRHPCSSFAVSTFPTRTGTARAFHSRSLNSVRDNGRTSDIVRPISRFVRLKR